MKKIILFAMLLILSVSSFSQQTKPSPDFTKQDYLLKSKKQKKVAKIIVGGGATLWLTGIIIPRGEATGLNSYYGLPGFGGKAYKNDGIKGALSLSGALSMLGSIPLFIASSKNKKKARASSVFINMEKIPALQQTVISNQSFPALGVRMSL